ARREGLLVSLMEHQHTDPTPVQHRRHQLSSLLPAGRPPPPPPRRRPLVPSRSPPLLRLLASIGNGPACPWKIRNMSTDGKGREPPIQWKKPIIQIPSLTTHRAPQPQATRMRPDPSRKAQCNSKRSSSSSSRCSRCRYRQRP